MTGRAQRLKVVEVVRARSLRVLSHTRDLVVDFKLITPIERVVTCVAATSGGSQRINLLARWLAICATPNAAMTVSMQRRFARYWPIVIARRLVVEPACALV
jgi:hypothetical protein